MMKLFIIDDGKFNGITQLLNHAADSESNLDRKKPLQQVAHQQEKLSAE